MLLNAFIITSSCLVVFNLHINKVVNNSVFSYLCFAVSAEHQTQNYPLIKSNNFQSNKESIFRNGIWTTINIQVGKTKVSGEWDKYVFGKTRILYRGHRVQSIKSYRNCSYLKLLHINIQKYKSKALIIRTNNLDPMRC